MGTPVSSHKSTKAQNHSAEDTEGQIKPHQQSISEGMQGLLRIPRNKIVWMSVAVLCCIGLLILLTGTLTRPAIKPTTIITASSYQTTAITSDGAFAITVKVAPNHTGPNTFTASVVNTKTGDLVKNVSMTLYVTNVEMDMGTEILNLQPNSQGEFKAPGDLSMNGHSRIRIQVRMPQSAVHEIQVTINTPY